MKMDVTVVVAEFDDDVDTIVGIVGEGEDDGRSTDCRGP